LLGEPLSGDEVHAGSRSVRTCCAFAQPLIVVIATTTTTVIATAAMRWAPRG
jgi:hypothetical protein